MMKNIIGLIPVLLAVPSYFLYLKGVTNKKIIPHMYSWLVWSILAMIGFFAQHSSNAGPAAWNTGITAVSCFIVFLFATKHGERHLTKTDTLLLFIAAIAISARMVTNSFTLATTLTTIAALIGFVFTLRKAYTSPYQENTATFFVNFLRNLISLFALYVISYNTFFYPFMMLIANMSVVVVIIYSKRKKSSRL